MDFPLFHLDWLGNRLLIAIIGVLHVIINHGLAVGMMPLIASVEWYAHRRGLPKLDALAQRMLFVAFIITTTVGALTGVGIWLSAGLINPYGIGSLIRVFFWGWFIEWLVFITEVVLILAYYLTWKKWQGEKKAQHIKLGFSLAIFSWITMALIVAILGFMMEPGHWMTSHSLWEGFWNPIYVPQLMFRTFMAAAEAGVIATFLTGCLVSKTDPLRNKMIRATSLWTLGAAPLAFVGAVWYRSVLPDYMANNLDVSLLTMGYSEWYGSLLQLIAAVILGIVAIMSFAYTRPQNMPRILPLFPLLGILLLTAQFERVREFVRKPYIIGRYMYANGVRAQDLPLYQSKGVLPYATYTFPLTEAELGTPNTALSPDEVKKLHTTLQQGKDVFMITCSRCHTGHGVNSVVTKFSNLMGDAPFNAQTLGGYMENMHAARTFMPPFPGSKAELNLLAEYIVHLQKTDAAIMGAQNGGVKLAPKPTPNAEENP